MRDKTRQIKEEEINIKFDNYINNRLTKTDKYKCLLDEKIKVLRIFDKIPNSFNKQDQELLKPYKEILNNETLFKSFINIIYYLTQKAMIKR